MLRIYFYVSSFVSCMNLKRKLTIVVTYLLHSYEIDQSCMLLKIFPIDRVWISHTFPYLPEFRFIGVG